MVLERYGRKQYCQGARGVLGPNADGYGPGGLNGALCG